MNVLEDSLLSCRNTCFTINMNTKRGTKKRKVDNNTYINNDDDSPPMLHLNPSKPAEYILQCLSILPSSLFHDRTSTDQVGFKHLYPIILINNELIESLWDEMCIPGSDYQNNTTVFSFNNEKRR